MAAYSASKAALDMLVRTWALELGPKQIRVNAVLPGIVESEMDSESTADLEAIRRMTANGVYRKAAEMGPVFQFLVSDASAPLTGSLVGAHDGISVGYSKEVLDRVSADIEGVE
jgi:NAD(P)-dependent dehydrogenase (short-subunit alcohol dehydrogenase family)